MRKVKCKPAIIALILFLVTIFSGIIAFGGTKTASADSFYYDNNSYSGAYAFYFEQFNITFDVKSNREMSVTEDLTVHYTGSASTGFMRDIPVNGGELVRDVRVTEIIAGKETKVSYSVEDYVDDNDVSYITADIGDKDVKTNEVHTYRLTYKYCLTKAQEGKNVLAINAIGVQSRSVKSAEIKFLLPDGFKSGSYVIGKMLASDNPVPVKAGTVNGQTAVVVSDIELAYNEGITFNFEFEEGALTTYTEFTPYWFVIAGAALLLILFAVKVLVFSKDKVVPVVNFEAPEKMNPLMMGKLIDAKIDPEDITSMLFYWADKGYLKIDLTDENDPTLIRIVQELPEGTPQYEQNLYAGVFGSNDVVKTSSLKYSFYRTIERVSKQVNAHVNSLTKGMYTTASVFTSLAFSVIAALIYGFAPLILALTQINASFVVGLLSLAACVIISVVLNFVGCNFKTAITSKNKKDFAMILAITLVIIVFLGFFYILNVPAGIVPLYVYFIYLAMFAVTTLLSSFIWSKSPEYIEKLNHIVGFRDFITLVEKDKLEKMLETNPQYYYHVLPYAQVLGVSDKWEEKFANITIAPPQWSTTDEIIRFSILNRAIRNSSRNMTRNMAARPQSSGGSGRGGFGGGHVGGGHGGGGSRGR